MSEPRLTTEQVRFHAAGHLAAAVSLIDAGNIEGARTVLGIIRDYLDHGNVTAPPQVKELTATALADPANSRGAVVTLERIFVDPFNTVIERSTDG